LVPDPGLRFVADENRLAADANFLLLHRNTMAELLEKMGGQGRAALPADSASAVFVATQTEGKAAP
jgi:hypothetical protein